MSESIAELVDPQVAPTAMTVVEAEELPLAPLSTDEDSFCLAMIECSGNVALAYKMAFGDGIRYASSKGKELLQQPNVQARIRELSVIVEDTTLFSLSTHLMELATIRDMAKLQGQLKVALQAERTRGEATGLYQQKPQNTGQTLVQVNMVSKYDVSI
jgi:hypothetical protein